MKDFQAFKKDRRMILIILSSLDVLKSLDNDTLTTGIARIEVIENHFSSIKSLSFIFALLGYLITYYTKISVNILGNEKFPNLVSFLICAAIFVYACKYYASEREKTKTCVYFKVLLEYAKENKKNKN